MNADVNYIIRPLEWELVVMPERIAFWHAKTVFGYVTVKVIGSVCKWATPYETWSPCDGIDDGKVKAELWYHERLLPALKLDPAK